MDKEYFVKELYNKGQIDFGINQWKDNNQYHFRFNGGRGIEGDADLLEMCAVAAYGVIQDIAPDATHIVGIPDAGLLVAKEISNQYDLGLLEYSKGWHSIHDFARYLKGEYCKDPFRCVEGLDPEDTIFQQIQKYVDEGLEEFTPHGSWGKLKGDVERGAKIVIFDNVASKTCESKFESMSILHKLLLQQGIRLGPKISVNDGVDAEIAGIVILQNNSPLAYDALDGMNFGAVLEAPETHGYLRQMGYITDENYTGVLEDLEFLGWFSDNGNEKYRGDKAPYDLVLRDFEELKKKRGERLKKQRL